MLLDADRSQVVLVDFQSRLMPAMFEHELVLANALRLAQAARWMGVPVWGTEQNPSRLGPNAPQLRELCLDTVEKMCFSGVGDELMQMLHSSGREAVPQQQGGSARSLPRHLQKKPQEVPVRSSVLLAGCETHVCLLQTALELLDDEDFDVWVVTDACSSRTERNRDAAFDRLASAGVELVTTEMVLFEWLRAAGHEHFREVQKLVK